MSDQELMAWAGSRWLEIGRESRKQWCVVNHSRPVERRYWLSAGNSWAGTGDKMQYCGFSQGHIAVRGATLRDALLAAAQQERDDALYEAWAAEYEAKSAAVVA